MTDVNEDLYDDFFAGGDIIDADDLEVDDDYEEDELDFFDFLDEEDDDYE